MSPVTALIPDAVFDVEGSLAPEMSFHRAPDLLPVLRMKGYSP
jgi:hypothetical protein